MTNSNKIILDLCGGTGSWSAPYKEAGYTVKIIDPLVTGYNDVRVFAFSQFEKGVHGVLAAPPCTEFSSSGARWWFDKGPEALTNALSVVDACLRIITFSNPVWWVLENPVGRLRTYLGPAKFIFDPYDFGDPYTKKTLLWGKFNNPKKSPVYPSEGSKLHKLPPSKDRAKIRSMTPPGFAKAFFEANP